MHCHKSELDQVSYIQSESSADRVIPLQPCYLGESNWESWLPTEKGVIRMPMVDVYDGCYFSKAPASAKDVHIRFISLIMKRAYFNDLVHFERGILEDINNLSASVVKINLFHEIWRADKEKIPRRFVTTEMEYIFQVCRSIFDLLQEVIMKIWSRFKYIDPDIETKKLKPTFSKMVFFEQKLSSIEEIQNRYKIPKQLAEFYSRHGGFFDWLRSYRDKISHGGKSIDALFITDDGFAIRVEDEPFKGLRIWENAELKTNGLGSVRSVISYAILNTLNTLEDFSLVIQSIMDLPPDISPDYDVYIRGENIDVLLELHKYVDGEAWEKI